jgi:tetratricopeptide (TPR) repeat protein
MNGLARNEVTSYSSFQENCMIPKRYLLSGLLFGIVTNVLLAQSATNLDFLWDAAQKFQNDGIKEGTSFLRTGLAPGVHKAVKWNNLAHELHLKGDSRKAVLYYRKSIDLWPNDSNTHSSLGEAAMDHGDYKTALAAFEAAILLSPSAAFYMDKGICHLKLGQLSEAISAVEAANLHSPNPPLQGRLHWILGEVALAKGDPEAARIHFEQAVKLHPGHTDHGESLRKISR